MKLRTLCLACRSDDVELIEDLPAHASARLRIFACYHCQDLFSFMTDAEPRPYALPPFALYGEPPRRRPRQ